MIVASDDEKSWQIWRGVMHDMLFMDVQRLDPDQPVAGSFLVVSAPSLMISKVSSSNTLSERTPALLRVMDNAFFSALYIRSGTIAVEAEQKQIVAGADSLIAIDPMRPFTCRVENEVDLTLVCLPHSMVYNPNDDQVSHFGQSSPAANVFISFLRQLESSCAALGPERVTAYRFAAAEMLRNVLDSNLCEASDGGRKTLQRICNRVRTELRNPNLSWEEIAKSEGVSIRTMHRLFQSSGVTPGQWMQEQRLMGAADDLRSRPVTKSIVTDVGLSWGFSSTSNFARAFRRRFGCSPKKWIDKGLD